MRDALLLLISVLQAVCFWKHKCILLIQYQNTANLVGHIGPIVCVSWRG